MRKSNKNSADKFIIILTLVHGNQKAQTRQPDVQCLFKILILCIFYGDEASSQNIYFTTLNALFYLRNSFDKLLCKTKRILCVFWRFYWIVFCCSIKFETNFSTRLWNWSHVMNSSLLTFPRRLVRICLMKTEMQLCFYSVSISFFLFTKPESRGKRLRWCKESINHKTPKQWLDGEFTFVCSIISYCKADYHCW